MIVFAWNVRGIANRATVRALKEYRRMYRPDCFFLFETRCSGEKAREVIRELGFQFAVVEDAAGFSGGIWVLWEDANLDIRLRESHHQYIHLSVDRVEWGSCLLTAIYASPQERHRATLWKKLQKGGEREGQNKVFKRLDRGLANIEWRTTFPDGRIEVLPRVRSDHHPLLARFVPSRVDVGEKPFRYETMWETHPNFNHYVKEAWPKEQQLPEALSTLTHLLKEWNKSVFGDVNRRKRRVMRRLEGIQQAREYGRIPFFDKLEKELTEELELILEQEEVMWQQRSRQKWITDRDRNTRFYHLKTVQRRRKNRICKLKGEDGRWCEDMEDLKHKAISYFKRIYNKDWMEEPIKITGGTYPPIHEDDVRRLSAPLSNEEIKAALFNIGSLKAPGEDGYPAHFFKEQWKVIRESFMEFIQKLWQDPSSVKLVNQTLIVLIPKIQQPEYLKQFRPIALCNVVYKCLSKIVVNRIKPTLVNRIAPFQSSFVQGRLI
ncbi:uncharacterized protein LOC107495506 [Arachis duranensis]|uniref:Uncharacterized protein LOC107495506 n=1 Tax=Arachis duranensis TaxID=130453 RepID=A0A6P4DQ57_ARADU|nr:uncharacterized protein LOC107495506 [Arachis duranensis]